VAWRHSSLRARLTLRLWRILRRWGLRVHGLLLLRRLLIDLLLLWRRLHIDGLWLRVNGLRGSALRVGCRGLTI
jgi:hypothetical protein